MLRNTPTFAHGTDGFRVGVTGSPGAGKSTLIEQLGMHCLGRGLRVAALAIDPSSQRSGGSILGDKTRMPRLANDARAFVRPSPASGQLGGVARSTYDSIHLCERTDMSHGIELHDGITGAGFDVVFVETVGVGQSELLVRDMVDVLVLVVAPGTGDELQGMKRGITEMADLILVNKAEEPQSVEVRRTLFEYKSAQKYVAGCEVLPVSGHTGLGVSAAWEQMTALRARLATSGALERTRRAQREKWIWSLATQELLARFETDSRVKARYRELVSQDDCMSSEHADTLLDVFLRGGMA